jgi:hypothetical protein
VEEQLNSEHSQSTPAKETWQTQETGMNERMPHESLHRTRKWRSMPNHSHGTPRQFRIISTNAGISIDVKHSERLELLNENSLMEAIAVPSHKLSKGRINFHCHGNTWTSGLSWGFRTPATNYEFFPEFRLDPSNPKNPTPSTRTCNINILPIERQCVGIGRISMSSDEEQGEFVIHSRMNRDGVSYSGESARGARQQIGDRMDAAFDGQQPI